VLTPVAFDRYLEKQPRNWDPDRAATYYCPVAFESKILEFFELDWGVAYKRKDTDFDWLINYISEQADLKRAPRSKKSKKDAVVY
jgi:hypothetical protein